MKLVYDFDIVLLHFELLKLYERVIVSLLQPFNAYATNLIINGSLILYGPALTRAYSRLT
jgi:hypothetical protein